jgi:hypothetical protein
MREDMMRARVFDGKADFAVDGAAPLAEQGDPTFYAPKGNQLGHAGQRRGPVRRKA